MSISGSSREEALSRIVQLGEKYVDKTQRIHEANEAATRLEIIDEILERIGWQKEDFNPESPTSSGYIDYLLSIDGVPRVIVEAKRGGKTFKVPSITMHEFQYSLSYFKRAYGRALNEVLEQATRYALERGVPYVVITNGAEWFVIQVIETPGQSSEDLRGYYFGNLLSKESNFDLFWELLSKVSVSQGSLEERLFILNYQPPKEIRTANSQFGVVKWKKVPEADSIRSFYNNFFGEIIDPRRRAMLDWCYAESTKLEQHKGELKRVLKDATPAYMPSDTKNVGHGEGQDFVIEDSGNLSGRVILIVGSAGCGKSTLVAKVIFESSRKESELSKKEGTLSRPNNNSHSGKKTKNLYIVKVDLINEATRLVDDVEPLLWKAIVEEWKEIERRNKKNSYSRESLQSLFNKEIGEFEEGEYSYLLKDSPDKFKEKEAEFISELKRDNLVFFAKCWRYHRSQNIGIVLILDNIDRTADVFQGQVYAFAHKVAEKTGATVLITLREFTFFNARETGFLDVRSEDTFIHLQAPDLERIISKRVKYIEQHIDEDFRVKEWRKDNKYEQVKEKSLEYATLLKNTFLMSNSGKNLLGFLASVSWHSVREFLNILRRVHSQLGNSSKVWERSEVIAALMTLNDIDAPSVIPNIFRPSYHNHQCYFLKLRIILMMTYGLRSGEVRSGVGFFKILTFARLYGYQSIWIEKSIQDLVREKLLECLEAPVSEDFTKNYTPSRNHTFRVSPLAVILVQEIIQEPTYLCLIGNELPFYDARRFDSYVDSLKKLLSSLDDECFERSAIDLLLDSTDIGKVIVKYLLEMYEIEKLSSNQIGNVSEVFSTENKLQEILLKFSEYSHDFETDSDQGILSSRANHHVEDDKGVVQISLFDTSNDIYHEADKSRLSNDASSLNRPSEKATQSRSKESIFEKLVDEVF